MQYLIPYTIYIPTPVRGTARHPYTRVSDPGSPRITGIPGHGSPWVTGSPWSRVLLGHRVTGLSGLLPAFSPWSGSPWSPWSWVTGHHGLPSPESQGHRVIGSRVTMVTGLPSPWFRVTYNHGLTT
jgi:hypothetical protein